MWKIACFTINFIIIINSQEIIKYTLYSGDNPNLILNQNNSDQINLNGTLIFIIHGWTQNPELKAYQNLKNAFLETDQDNYVIMVDWSKLAGEWYGKAVTNTKIVGNFLDNFMDTNGIPPENIHLVGHSLGGHVAGFAGKIVRKKLARITALDPAGPLFDNMLLGDEHRLNSADAHVVVVLHTDGGKFGYRESLGTVDIYFNGGHSPQPGCIENTGKQGIFCSHSRSMLYYMEALKNDDFIAEKCANHLVYSLGFCANGEKLMIGGRITSEYHGNYFVDTNSKPPFCCKIV